MSDSKTIIAEVITVIPDFHQTVCRTNGGWQYTVTRKAHGVPWYDLKEGDIVTLEVYTEIPIVKKVINVNP